MQNNKKFENGDKKMNQMNNDINELKKQVVKHDEKFEKIEKKIDQADNRICQNWNKFNEAMRNILDHESNNRSEIDSINANLREVSANLKIAQDKNKEVKEYICG